MTYHAPTTLDAALDRMAKGDVSLLAGGTDYFPAQEGLPSRSEILDLTRIAGLRGISRAQGGWRIGATTTWSEIARAPLPSSLDALQQAAGEIGALQIQNVATIGGNLCNASPAADGVPPLLVLGAEIELAAHGGRRVMRLDEFITGVRQTALRPGEIVSAVLIPEPPGAACSAFEKLGARRYLVISIAMVAALLVVQGGRIDEARIAVGACSPVATRLTALENDLKDQPVEYLATPGFVTPAHLAPLAPIDDVRADAAYRFEAVAELIRRALARAAEGAHG